MVPCRLKLRPQVHFRAHEDPVNKPLADAYSLTVINERCELSIPGSEFPPLRFRLFAEEGAFTIQGRKIVEMMYRIEESRGYDFRGEQWAPGYFRSDLSRDHPVTLAASTESWDSVRAIPPADGGRGGNGAARHALGRRPARRSRRIGRGIGFGRRPVPVHPGRPSRRRRPSTGCAATKSVPSSPAIIGSRIGAATR